MTTTRRATPQAARFVRDPAAEGGIAATARRLLQADTLRESAIRAAIDALHLPPGSDGLDAGCGIGSHTTWLARSVSPAGGVTGVDIEPALLRIARERAAAAATATSPPPRFVEGDLLALPFDDATFDWTWSADTIHGIRPGDPLVAMRELVRVTRPGGVVAVLFWSAQRLLPGYPRLEAALDVAFAAVVPYIAVQPEAHFMAATGWLRRLGLTAVSARTFVGDLVGPLEPAFREALAATFEMLWGSLGDRLGDDERALYDRLCRPGGAEFLPDRPDYHGFLAYSMFSGRVP